MDQLNMTEIIGYIASAVVLFSFLNKDIKKLRIFNTIGCALFIIYGILLHYSIPLIITNIAIVGINMYHLFSNQKSTSFDSSDL